MDTALLSAVVHNFDLGQSITKPACITGGLLNSMWRVETNMGVYAVKVLANRDDAATFSFRYAAAFQLEMSAFAAGISMPQPVPNPITGGPIAELYDSAGHAMKVLVHHWVSADPVKPGPVTGDFSQRVGEIVGRIHHMDLDVPKRSLSSGDGMPKADVWHTIAEEAAKAHLSWAGEMSRVIDTFIATCVLVDQLSKHAGRVVFTHGDINQKNLLSANGEPVLIDWETSDHRPIVHELGSTSLALAERTDGSFDEEVLAAFFAGYKSFNDELPEVGPEWLITRLADPTHFALFNMNRGLTPGNDDAATQARAQLVVEKMLVDIPAYFNNVDSTVAALRKATTEA